jgi:hypothetical protein
MNTTTATIPGLIEPTAVVPAQLVPYVPPPQPAFVPAASRGVPGVVIPADGVPYYGFAPVIYAEAPAPIDPQVAAQVALMNAKARLMAGSGVFAAGAGFGAAEVIGAVAGAGVGALLAAAALLAVGKFTGTRISTVNHNEIHEENNQYVSAVATGWFGKASSAVTNAKTFNSSTTVR